MKYNITHTTTYGYSSPASLSQNEVLLRPRNTNGQLVEHYALELSQQPQYQRGWTDFFGNSVEVFMVQHAHDELSINARSIVETFTPTFPLHHASPPWETVRQQLLLTGPQSGVSEVLPFLYESPFIMIDQEVVSYAMTSFLPGTPILAAAMDLTSRIFADFEYNKEASTVDTTVQQVFREKKGVCQDFAHLAIACLRAMGLAARYVSGYLETLPPPGKPKLIGADASHAWFSVYVPGNGWIDFDPTNNQQPNESYVVLAWGRDYGDVAPVKGVVLGGGSHQLSVMVDVAQMS